MTTIKVDGKSYTVYVNKDELYKNGDKYYDHGGLIVVTCEDDVYHSYYNTYSGDYDPGVVNLLIDALDNKHQMFVKLVQTNTKITITICHTYFSVGPSFTLEKDTQLLSGIVPQRYYLQTKFDYFKAIINCDTKLVKKLVDDLGMPFHCDIEDLKKVYELTGITLAPHGYMGAGDAIMLSKNPAEMYQLLRSLHNSDDDVKYGHPFMLNFGLFRKYPKFLPRSFEGDLELVKLMIRNGDISGCEYNHINHSICVLHLFEKRSPSVAKYLIDKILDCIDFTERVCDVCFYLYPENRWYNYICSTGRIGNSVDEYLIESKNMKLFKCLIDSGKYTPSKILNIPEFLDFTLNKTKLVIKMDADLINCLTLYALEKVIRQVKLVDLNGVEIKKMELVIDLITKYNPSVKVQLEQNKIHMLTKDSSKLVEKLKKLNTIDSELSSDDDDDISDDDIPIKVVKPPMKKIRREARQRL